jgi:hypothetical protein
MVDIVAANVTITVQKRLKAGKRRRNRCKIEFGNGSLTYPAGGVPMPAAKSFAMNGGVLEYLVITDGNDASGLIWKYDQDNKKLRAYVQGYDHGAGGAVTLDDYPVVAAAGVTSGISVSLTTGAGAGVGRLGGLQELLGGTDAPAAQVLYVEAVGW